MSPPALGPSLRVTHGYQVLTAHILALSFGSEGTVFFDQDTAAGFLCFVLFFN